MAEFKSPRTDEKGRQLPRHAPEDSEYIALAAGRWWNYTLGQWLRENREVQARVIANYLEHNTRESYFSEQQEKYRKLIEGGESAPQVNYDSCRQGGG